MPGAINVFWYQIYGVGSAHSALRRIYTRTCTQPAPYWRDEDGNNRRAHTEKAADVGRYIIRETTRPRRSSAPRRAQIFRRASASFKVQPRKKALLQLFLSLGAHRKFHAAVCSLLPPPDNVHCAVRPKPSCGPPPPPTSNIPGGRDTHVRAAAEIALSEKIGFFFHR